MDHLIESMHRKEKFRWFVLDGQTVVLEDYLEVKPWREEELKSLVREGRIFVGPLYVQPDEFIVSGESIIRNFIIGSRIARQFGRRMNIGYFPDPFGHIRQMPQILKGFGLDSFMFMRGMGDEVENLGLEFFWKAPDKESSVLAINQINSYGNVRSLGVPFSDPWHFSADYDEAIKQVDFEVETLGKYANTPLILLNNGIDHHPAQPEIVDIIEYINKKRTNYRLVHSNFERYIRALQKYKDKFKTYTGEFRGGYRHWVLSGVYSSRLYLKQENEKAQTLLENVLEPLSLFLWLNKAKYPSDILLHLWKLLLKNHPHDDICGCSIDAVHDDMMVRYRHLNEAISYLLWLDKTELLDRIKFKTPDYGEPIVVFNTLPWEREWLQIEQDVFLPEFIANGAHLYLVNSKGEHVYARFINGEKVNNAHLWGDTIMQSVKVKFLVPSLPGLGYETFYVRNAKESEVLSPSLPSLKMLKRGMENKFYKITINDDGTLNIADKERGLTLERIHWFEDSGDKGDEYDYSYIAEDRPLTTQGKAADDIALIESGPDEVTWKIRHTWKIPATISADRQSRSARKVALDIETTVTLRAGSKRIDFHTRVLNRAEDHRLRCGFRIPFSSSRCLTEGSFDVIERRHITPEEMHRQEQKGWMQPAQPTAPQERFVSFDNKETGVSFINKGLREYEAGAKEGISYYYLTLLRATGWISRPDILTRKDGAGPTIPAPGGQCPGSHEMFYSLTTHKGNCFDAGVGRTAMNHNVLPYTVAYENRFRGKKSKPILPERYSLIQISPPSPVLCSAIKKAEERNSIIVRLFNPSPKSQTVKVTMGRTIKQVYKVRLDEKREEPIAKKFNSSFTLKIPAYKIVTLEIVC